MHSTKKTITLTLLLSFINHISFTVPRAPLSLIKIACISQIRHNPFVPQHNSQFFTHAKDTKTKDTVTETCKMMNKVFQSNSQDIKQKEISPKKSINSALMIINKHEISIMLHSTENQKKIK